MRRPCRTLWPKQGKPHDRCQHHPLAIHPASPWHGRRAGDQAGGAVSCPEPGCTYPAGTACTMTGCPGRRFTNYEPAPSIPIAQPCSAGATLTAGGYGAPTVVSQTFSLGGLYSYAREPLFPQGAHGEAPELALGASPYGGGSGLSSPVRNGGMRSFHGEAI